jgi:hypothetical protein
LHHCFFHSEISGDIPKEELEQEWNYQSCPVGIHACIHHASTEQMVAKGNMAEIKYKERALERYEGKYRKFLEEIVRRKKKSYGLS